MQPQQNQLPPEQMLMQMGMSYYPSHILSTAIQLDVFSTVGKTQKTFEEVSRATGTSTRGMRMLLDGLVALSLLTKEEGKYGLTPTSDRFLRKDSPDYMGAMYENNMIYEAWMRLPEVVRTGKPADRVESPEFAEKFFPSLIKSLHVINREPAKMTAKVIRPPKGARVLDVACGSGVWGIAMAEADREVRVTAQDFPGVLEHTKGFLKRHEVESRFDFLPGDLKKVDFGAAKYDVALLGNIVHSEGEKSSVDLFRRLHKALKPGGKMVVIDMIPNNERSGPPFPLFFALNMLVHTEFGSTYTLAEYSDWLKSAGFQSVETADIHSHSPLVIGTR